MGASVNDPELMEPRADEQLPMERLEPYLRSALPDTDGSVRVRQFRGGHANLTYLLTFGDTEYVLRRPPLGPVAPGSHDMGREYRVLSRLYRCFHLAPRSFLHCDDPDIIGAQFQVMERRHGIVIRKHMPAEAGEDHGIRRRIGEMLVDVLADLHAVDREASGLVDLGHPQGYVERQVEGWAKRWHAAAHEHDAHMIRLIAWLVERMPKSLRATLLHNDYKLDNMMVDAADLARPVAIFDWDMCTSGDPLMDLGYLLNQWAEPGDDPDWIEGSAMPTWQPGFPGRDEVVQRYAKRTGIEVGEIDWYHAFAAMKFAAVIQQIYIRYRRGQTRDERFADYDARATSFVRKGYRIAGLP
jgi:aminoglycoside phosphotransferase (APT) family kinase protein